MKNQAGLFDTLPYKKDLNPQKKNFFGERKIKSPIRNQMEFKMESLDDRLPYNHNARLIWDFVNKLDLSLARDAIISMEGDVGRKCIDPRLLVSLWIYGISEGIISARKITQYCKEHIGFAWLCGGVSVGHHTLSKFRSSFGGLFNDLVIQSTASLLSNDIIKLKEVAQDGVKIRAYGSEGSRKRKQTVKEKVLEVQEYIKTLEEEIKRGALEKREKAKKEQAILAYKNKQKLLNEALKELNVFKKQKKESLKRRGRPAMSRKEQENLRVSITDPESRNMKMNGGGYSLAYNVQIATEVNSELALGFNVSQIGADNGLMLPMYQNLKSTYNQKIDSYLVDAGFRNNLALQTMYEDNCKVYIPVGKKSETLRNKVLAGNDNSIPEFKKEWILRMNSEEGNLMYNRRIRASETINAYFKNHGLNKLLVKGKEKAKGIIALFCLTYNIMTMKRLKITI